jgi:DNA-binding YbaB/EbfC family protein
MNFSEIMDMFRNPQAIQARVAELREKTARLRATGSAGGGLVTITLNGEMEMLSCSIAPEILDPADPGMVQDLVRAAFNDAITKIRELLQSEMSSGMDGIPMPPGLGL